MNKTNDATPAIFFDRDGTLIEEVDFLASVEETRLFPFTIEALGLLRDAGYLFFVTTNQSGIARGFFDATAVNAIHAEIQNRLAEAGLRIESFHFCPHLPDAGCPCRKPAPGMIRQACLDREIDLARSWVVGDKDLDIGLGRRAGTRTALVRTGYGEEHRRRIEPEPDIVAADLLEAAREIVAAGRTGRAEAS